MLLLNWGPPEQPKTSTQTQKADVNSKQDLPEPLKKESKSQNSILQNTGPGGEGEYDSMTGQLLVSTEEQLQRAKVGDKVVGPLKAELDKVARGD